MNLPQVKPYQDTAVDTMVSVINSAKESLGTRMTLRQLAKTRDMVTPAAKVNTSSLKCPLPITGEHLIKQTIERKWRLTDKFMYVLKYLGITKDETSLYYYFEAIFTQPTPSYPIPQATASVFFCIEDTHINPPKLSSLPKMTFRVEGHRKDHDVRYVLLIADWILAVLQMKIKYFRRVEEMRLF